MIVVGGGPVGLVCALTLAQHDIPVLVLEAHAELSSIYAPGRFIRRRWKFWSRCGVTKKLLDIGIVVPAGNCATAPTASSVRSTSLLKDETPYPYRLHCEQHKLTPLVYDMLKGMPNVDVRFSGGSREVTQDGGRRDRRAGTPEGHRNFQGRWVIGADGGGSIVRKSAGIQFDGFTYPEKFALISTSYDLGARGFTDTAYISHPVEWCAVFHLPHLGPPGLWRFLYGCTSDESDDEALWRRSRRGTLAVRSPKRAATKRFIGPFTVCINASPITFRKGRMLLAGDFAHLNNPLGGFGLNSALAGRDEPHRQAHRRLARQGDEFLARSLCAPTAHRQHRIRAGIIDPQQTRARGNRSDPP